MIFRYLYIKKMFGRTFLLASTYEIPAYFATTLISGYKCPSLFHGFKDTIRPVSNNDCSITSPDHVFVSPQQIPITSRFIRVNDKEGILFLILQNYFPKDLKSQLTHQIARGNNTMVEWITNLESSNHHCNKLIVLFWLLEACLPLYLFTFLIVF